MEGDRSAHHESRDVSPYEEDRELSANSSRSFSQHELAVMSSSSMDDKSVSPARYSTHSHVSSDDRESLGDLSLNFGPKEPVNYWKKLQNCEEFVGAKRSKHTMVAWDDRIYVFGGDNGRRMLNDFLVSTVHDSSWARVVYTGTPPTPRYHHSAVVFQNSMFVFGGYTGDVNSNLNLRNSNELFEYKFNTSQWINWQDKVTGSLPPARSAHGAAIFDNKLWVFAGYDGNTRLNDMWAIDLLTSNPQWEKIDQSGDSPPTCCNFPVAVVGDSMYVFSGQSGAKITNNLYEFKFLERRWVRIPMEHLLKGDTAPPQRRYGHSMVAYNRCLYVFGGAADGILDNEVHCFDVDSRTWSVIQPAEGSQVPSGRVFHSAAICDDAMYIFAGTVDSMVNRSGEFYRFRFSSFHKCTLVDDFDKLLSTMQFCDTHFLVGEGVKKECIKAHAVVVAARSPFLRRKILEIYTAGNKDATSQTDPPFLCHSPVEVTLEGVSPETVHHAMYFMYTDRIHGDLETHSRIDGMSSTQVLLMMDLYKFSLLLETHRLELLCMQYLEAAVSEDNVLLVLQNASELNLTSLKEYCMRFIVRDSNYRKIIMTTEFETLDHQLMVEIVRRQQFRSRPTSPSHHSGDEDSVTPSSLQDDLREFLLSDVGQPFADLFLRVGDTEIPAHKPVLVARCAYFEALCRSFMPTDHRIEITFGKVVPSQEAFQSLLKYLYYGEVNMPPEDSLYIFSAPNFFGFTNTRLQSFCKCNLERSVSLENVVKLLEVSDNISLEAMKRHCLNLITAHFPSLISQPEFRELSKELLLEVLETLAKRQSRLPTPHYQSNE